MLNPATLPPKTLENECMDVKYKRYKSNRSKNLKFPVYAGEDGSVVVFNTVKDNWEQLNQTHDKTNGYWVVSLQRRLVVPGQKLRDEIDVHILICSGWNGEPKPPKTRVDHKNGDPDDNSAGNLVWIDSLGNANKAKKHEKQFPSDFNKIIIDCRKLNNGKSILSSVSITKTDGVNVSALELVGHGKGRPPTRLSSLLETLFLTSGGNEIEKENANVKMKSKIDRKYIIWQDNALPYSDTIIIRKD